MTQNKINQGFYLQCVLEVFNIVAIDIYNQQSIKGINKRCVMQSREIFDYDRSFCKSADSCELALKWIDWQILKLSLYNPFTIWSYFSCCQVHTEKLWEWQPYLNLDLTGMVRKQLKQQVGQKI